MRLSLEETVNLIRRVGFTLSHSSKVDLIVGFFMRAGMVSATNGGDFLSADTVVRRMMNFYGFELFHAHV